MGAVPSQLRDSAGNKSLKIVNKVGSERPSDVDKLDLSGADSGSDVNLLVSITRDKTVIISEGKTIATQTDDNIGEMVEMQDAPKDNKDVDDPMRNFVLITENSQAPIETTLTNTQATETLTTSRSKSENENEQEATAKKSESNNNGMAKTPVADTPNTTEDATAKDGDTPKTTEDETAKDGEEDDDGFGFDQYDATKIGDPINYETAALQRYGKYKVQLARDKNKCIVTAATFLDSGDVIIIDRSNQRVKYIDANFEYISSYELPHKPWAVCARGGDIYVTMGNTMVQHLFVKDMIIEPERILEITGRCLGLCMVEEYIAVGLQVGEVALIDTMGHPQKTIELPKLENGSPCNPWHLSLTREQNLLVTDSDARTVFCVNMDSEVLFTLRTFSSPRGTAVDNQGNIILAGRDDASGTVAMMLSRDFELQNILHMEGVSKGRSLLTWAELEFVPYCVAYRSDNVVVLGGIQEALKIMRIVS